MSDTNSVSDTGYVPEDVDGRSVYELTFIPADEDHESGPIRLYSKEGPVLTIDAELDRPTRFRMENESGETVFTQEIEDPEPQFSIPHTKIVDATGQSEGEITVWFIFEHLNEDDEVEAEGLVGRIKSAVSTVISG